MAHEIHLDRTGIGAPIWVGAFSSLMDVGVLVLGEDTSLQYASPRALQLLGYADADALSRDLGSFLEQIATTSQSASGPMDVFVTAGSPGEERGLRCEVHPIDEDGCTGTLLLIQSRDRAEAIDASLRLATRYRTLAGLYATTAHDVKGSLNSITLNLELVRQTAAPAGPQNAMVQRALGALQRETDRLGRMVTAILDQGRADSSDVGLVDLQAMVTVIGELLGPRVARQRVAIDLDAPAPAVIWGRADWVQQAILNLAHNALEAMPDGGRMRIAVENAESHVDVVVSDTGPGVPSEALPRIFDLHFTTKPGGHGLGLYVARRAAQAHKGDLLVSSTSGGAEFRLRLPRDPVNR